MSGSEIPSRELRSGADHPAEPPKCARGQLQGGQMDGLWYLLGSEAVSVGPNWSCSRGLSLPPEPGWQNGFKQAAAANLLNVSTRNSASSAAAAGEEGCYHQ